MILMAAFSKNAKPSPKETGPAAVIFQVQVEEAAITPVLPRAVPRAATPARPTFRRQETHLRPRLPDLMGDGFQMMSLMQKTMTYWRASYGKRLSVKPTLN